MEKKTKQIVETLWKTKQLFLRCDVSPTAEIQALVLKVRHANLSFQKIVNLLSYSDKINWFAGDLK